jgi:hypothetical protein
MTHIEYDSYLYMTHFILIMTNVTWLILSTYDNFAKNAI